MKLTISILTISLLFAGGVAKASLTAAPRSCVTAINSQLTDWHLAKVSTPVAAWAEHLGFNPRVAHGDFDGDGALDYAVLIEQNRKRKIAVCFYPDHRARVVIIDNPYCTNYIRTSPANSKHYNFVTGQNEIIDRAGISAMCIQRAGREIVYDAAGATYVYEKDQFREIVDSD